MLNAVLFLLLLAGCVLFAPQIKTAVTFLWNKLSNSKAVDTILRKVGLR